MVKRELAPIGKLLQKERQLSGLTLEQLGKKIGYTAPYISRIEHGDKPLTREMAEKLAATFHVRLQYLLGIDKFRVFNRKMLTEYKISSLQLQYWESIGFSFQPCYVWRPSLFAAVMGYQLVKPYIGKKSIVDYTDEVNCTDIFNYFEQIDYANVDIVKKLLTTLLDDYISAGNKARDLFDTYLGAFELSGDPFENSDFLKIYTSTCNIWDDLHLQSSNWMHATGIPYCSQCRKIINSRPLSLGTSVELNGFLSGSSIEFCYALSENNKFKNFVSCDDMRRMIGNIARSSASIINSMFG